LAGIAKRPAIYHLWAREEKADESEEVKQEYQRLLTLRLEGDDQVLEKNVRLTVLAEARRTVFSNLSEAEQAIWVKRAKNSNEITTPEEK
jgi:23S rRNA maturation mini-RNase III